MEELMVFDIQRFALHDGPGIRTTVFLKGCPLDCAWCHNPESKSPLPQLGFLHKNCTACGRCEAVCRHGVHRITDTGEHTINFTKCVGCGSCVASCNNRALKMYGQKMSGGDMLKTVMKDRDFYIRSGGGLTVSGGEPMYQYESLLRLLKRAKRKGLHVCLDTSGLAPAEQYRAIAPYVDIFLFDYKATDTNDHKKYTGVDNGLILRNLEELCARGSRIFLRCPVIPGINDNDRHFKAIAELSRQYDSIEQVNLMTYHDMGKGKAEQTGISYGLLNAKTIEANEKQMIYAKVKAYGCLKLQEG